MAKNKKNRKPNDIDTLIDMASENIRELVKEGIEENDWNNVRLYTRMKLVDFVERRFMGMNENNLAFEHELNRVPFRLAHIEDSPRKRAAEVVLEKCRECYEQVMDLAFRQEVMDETRNILDRREYALDDEKRREIRRRNGENSNALREATERFRTYQNFLGSFFMDHAIAKHTEGRIADPFEVNAERQVLQELSEALPEGPEYDIFRTRAGYEEQQAMTMRPREALLVMNPNVITNVTVEDYPASIRGEHPSRLNLEWGAGTFDNMMEGLYDRDAWREIQRSGRNLLDTVYLDGRLAASVFPRKPDEEKDIYERRVKSEITAYALEGKGKVDVTPLRKDGDQYTFGDPIPVRVQVNLPEKVSGWNRFLRYFNIKIETKKEKAERISFDDLNKDERIEEIRRKTAELAERENINLIARETMEHSKENVFNGDMDFFGYLVTGKGLPRGPKMTEALDQIVHSQVNKIVSEEMAKKLGGLQPATLIKTMGRASSRSDLVRLFAIQKGMSIKDVLSNDPGLREQKEAIGRDFMEIISLKSEEEFHKENGAEASYEEYFHNKALGVRNLITGLHETLHNIPYDFFKGNSPQEIMERYEEWHFLSLAGMDLYQCRTDYVRNMDVEELDRLDTKTKGIISLSSTMDAYCEYLTSDEFVQQNTAPDANNNKMAYVYGSKINAENLVTQTGNITKIGDLSEVLNEKWEVTNLDMSMKLIEKCSSGQGFREVLHYLRTGRDPIHYFDERTEQYVVGSAAEVDRALKEKAAQGRNAVSWQDFEVIHKKDILKNRPETAEQKKALEKKVPEKTPERKQKGPQL